MKIIPRIAAAIAAALTLWFTVSYIDVISDNIKENPRHSDLNAFVLLFEYMEESDQ